MLRQLSAAFAFVIVTTGCAAHPTPLAAPLGLETTLHAATAPSPQTPSLQTNDLSISSELASRCNVTVGDVDDAPKFDFDRADLTASARSVLGQLARCVTTGPLRGRGLVLVGRADSRGEGEYNVALGARRAGSAASYLADLGVSNALVTTTSRGSLDATGVDERGWSRDRRVDILLASQFALPPEEERRQR
jgi:peptidoglycan-associated lipoprotein